jgi:hypothetical protein
MAKISSTGEINSIRLKEQGSDPSTPASGYGSLYIKTDGVYFKNDGGTVTGPFAGTVAAAANVRQFLFTVEGTVSTGTGNIRIPNYTGGALTISAVYLDINTAPTGTALICDINMGGTTIFTTQSNRPQIADGAYSGTATTIEVSSWANGQYLTMDLDQVGSTVAGADLTVTVVTS